jgi:hypothetical protein
VIVVQLLQRLADLGVHLAHQLLVLQQEEKVYGMETKWVAFHGPGFGSDCSGGATLTNTLVSATQFAWRWTAGGHETHFWVGPILFPPSPPVQC